MYQFAASQEAITLKLPALFLKFKTEERVLRLIKVRFLVKTLLIEIILSWKVTMDPIRTKKLCFGYF